MDKRESEPLNVLLGRGGVQQQKNSAGGPIAKSAPP